MAEILVEYQQLRLEELQDQIQFLVQLHLLEEEVEEVILIVLQIGQVEMVVLEVEVEALDNQENLVLQDKVIVEETQVVVVAIPLVVEEKVLLVVEVQTIMVGQEVPVPLIL